MVFDKPIASESAFPCPGSLRSQDLAHNLNFIMTVSGWPTLSPRKVWLVLDIVRIHFQTCRKEGQKREKKQSDRGYMKHKIESAVDKNGKTSGKRAKCDPAAESVGDRRYIAASL